MSHPLRDFVIAPRETKRKAVAFDGQTLYVKKLKAREVRDILAEQERGDKGIHPQVWWIIGALCDETGARILQWTDAERLNDLDASDVMFLHDEIILFNAANKTPEDIAKNS